MYTHKFLNWKACQNYSSTVGVGSWAAEWKRVGKEHIPLFNISETFYLKTLESTNSLISDQSHYILNRLIICTETNLQINQGKSKLFQFASKSDWVKFFQSGEQIRPRVFAKHTYRLERLKFAEWWW